MYKNNNKVQLGAANEPPLIDIITALLRCNIQKYEKKNQWVCFK